MKQAVEDADYTYVGVDKDAAAAATMAIRVGGMMCENCERHVSEALKKVDGIEDAKADHTTGIVALTVTKDPDEKAMKQAVEDADYTYEGEVRENGAA